ncbi:hypothetical protein ACA910_006077 [Epithemia clementina (nom. ined.)]
MDDPPLEDEVDASAAAAAQEVMEIVNDHDNDIDNDNDDDENDTTTPATTAAATKKATTTTTAGRPWVERYRPKNLQQVSHQPEVVATLQSAVATGRLPHLLFYGPPGSGKTSAALALCRQLWEPSQWRRRVLELNASDERGISVVRDKIKHFASLSVGHSNPSQPTTSTTNKKTKKRPNFFGTTTPADGPNDSVMEVEHGGDKDDSQKKDTKGKENNNAAAPSSYPNPPYKIIILDEADTVTPDAQAALRRIIEAYSKITRFILICNYVTRIIEPLASRCAKFRFQALPPESMRGRLMEIAKAEGCDTTHLDAILRVAKGDMRRAVTTLQSAHALHLTSSSSSSSSQYEKDEDRIAEMAGLPPPSAVDDLMQSFAVGTFDVMKQAVDHVLAEGYSAQLLLLALLPHITNSTQLTELYKAELCLKMAQAEHCMVQGADEGLQLLTVGSTAVQCFAKSKQAIMKQQP